jgi:hypothetical protein
VRTHESEIVMTSQVATVQAVSLVRRNRAVVAGGIAGAVVIAVALNAAVAAIAHAAGAPHGFSPLLLPTFALFTVAGIVIGAAGWARIRARSARPRALLRWLVPVVLTVSYVPDLLVGISGLLPGTTWGAVAGLMVMHVVVIGVAVPAYRLLLPLPGNTGFDKA